MKKRLLLLICSTVLFLSSKAQDYRIENNEVKITEAVSFETGSDKITAESEAALKIIKKYLDDKSYISLLRVECHTDDSGNQRASQTLSQKRAYAVCAALVSMGVDCKRLLPVGFGGTKPIAENSTPGGRASNRRVSFVNAALSGHLIGGMPADGGGMVAGDICSQ